MNKTLSKDTVHIRGKRMQAISAFWGKPEALSQQYVAEAEENEAPVSFLEDGSNDILYALSIIATIKEAAVVLHGSSECAAARLISIWADSNHGKWGVTNVGERDSIMGSDLKLRRTITQIYKRQRPQVVFVVPAPAVAMNKEDVDFIIKELKEELGVPIVALYTEGFQSKIGTTGYDLVSHSIVHQLFSPDNEVKAYFVNLLSVSEQVDDVIEVNRLLREIGLITNIFPRHSSLPNFFKAKNASHSIAINPDEANYPGEILQKQFRIPYIESVIPIGLENTIRWIRTIGKATGQEENTERIIREEETLLGDYVARNQFADKRVFVSLPPQQAIAIANLLRELGFQYLGLKLAYMDEQHIDFLNQLAEEIPGFQLLIGDRQLSEEENVIRELHPDLYVGSGNDFRVAIRNGIPVVNLSNVSILGFNGIRKFVAEVNKIRVNHQLR